MRPSKLVPFPFLRWIRLNIILASITIELFNPLFQEYHDHPCKNAFLPFVKYHAPFVFLTDWKQLPKVLAMFSKEPEKVTYIYISYLILFLIITIVKVVALQERLRPWYQKFLYNVSVQLDMVTGRTHLTPKQSVSTSTSVSVTSIIGSNSNATLQPSSTPITSTATESSAQI